MSSSTSASSTSAFGSPLLFGQTGNSNASSTNPFGSQHMPGQTSSTNISGLLPSTRTGGNSMGLFGSMQGTLSTPTVWGSSSASMNSSTNGFGSGVGFRQSINPNVSSIGSSGTQYTFGQSGNPFGSASDNGSRTSTGVFGQTASNISFGQSSNIFGPVSNNGRTSTGVFGQTASNSSFGQSSNIFGSVPSNGGTLTGLFGTNASSTPFGFQHTLGSVPASAGTSLVVYVVTVSPFSSASIATSSSPISWGSSTGNQVGAPSFGPFDNSSFGEKRGSTVTSYTTTTTVGEKGECNMFVSISAMPSYQNKSHEELRWEDHHQSNAGGGGVVHALVQSNDFRNPIGRTDLSTFPSPLPPFVPSNPFSTTVTPSIGQHSLLNPVPPSVPSNPFTTVVTPPSTRQHSFLNPAPPSVPSNLFATAVTPTGQYSFLNPAPPSVPSNPFGGSTNFKLFEDKSKTDASVGKESKHQQKLQWEEMEKSMELICKDIIRHQEDMISWIVGYRSLELEKMEDTQTIKQLREELAQVTKSKDAIIAEYLKTKSPDTIQALSPDTVQTKLPDSGNSESPGTVQTKLPEMVTWELI